MKTEISMFFRMLGSLSIKGPSGILQKEDLGSSQIAKLLVYLYLNRSVPQTLQSLSEALWQDKETYDPAAGIRNVVYRARKLCAPICDGKEPVTAYAGSYILNPEITIHTDIERVLQICDIYKKNGAGTDDEILNELCDLISGPFLGSEFSDIWIITNGAEINSSILDEVGKLIVRLIYEKKYSISAKLCRRALSIDAMAEEIHSCYVHLLIMTGNHQTAFDYYKNVTEKLISDYGVKKPLYTYEELSSEKWKLADKIK